MLNVTRLRQELDAALEAFVESIAQVVEEHRAEWAAEEAAGAEQASESEGEEPDQPPEPARPTPLRHRPNVHVIPSGGTLPPLGAPVASPPDTETPEAGSEGQQGT